MPRRRGGRSRGPSPFQLALMQAPPSDMTKVVFKYDLLQQDYSQSDFNPAQTQGRVTQQDIDNVFNTMRQLPNYKIAGSCLIALIPIALFLLFIVAFLGVFYFMMTSITSADSDNFIVLPIVMFGLFFIGFLVMFGATFGINYYYAKKS